MTILVLQKAFFVTGSYIICHIWKFMTIRLIARAILSSPRAGVGASLLLLHNIYTMGPLKKIQWSDLPPPILLISNKQVSHTWMLQDWLLIFWMLEHFVQTSMDIWWLRMYPDRITNRLNRLSKILCRIFKI